MVKGDIVRMVDTYWHGDFGEPRDDIGKLFVISGVTGSRYQIRSFEHGGRYAWWNDSQLEFVEHSPHIAAIINLYEDHLDHAGTIEHYHQDKLNIFKYQNSDDYSIYCKDIEPLNSYINDSYKGIKYGINFNSDNTINW